MKNKPFTLKTFLIISISTLFLNPVKAQYYEQDVYSATKYVTIYTSDFIVGKKILNNYLSNKKCEVLNQEINTRTFEVSFQLNENLVGSLDSTLGLIGYITSSTQNNNNNKLKVKKLESELDDNTFKLDKLRNKYKLDSNANSRKNLEFAMENLEESNRRITRNLTQIKENYNSVFVKVTINDELSTPTNSKIAFAKMPGVSYNRLYIENPKPGISESLYTGYNMKYIFTKGKSYFQIGVLKNANDLSKVTIYDSLKANTINEFFTFEFGQDFYTRYFGRGNRKFFNLYSGYSIGGAIINRWDDQNARFAAFTNLSMGLELLKTKHILIDVKGSYFLPLADINRNTRGIMMSGSFNFVF
jgi:hypothetical protein